LFPGFPAIPHPFSNLATAALFLRASFSGDLCELTLCANYKRRLMKISPSPVCRPLENHRTATPSTSVERRDIDVPPTATAAASGAAASAAALQQANPFLLPLFCRLPLDFWLGISVTILGFCIFFFVLDFNCWLVSF